MDKDTLEVIEKDLPDDLNSISTLEVTAIGYKSMNPTIYFVITIVLYTLEVILGLTFK